MKNNLNLTKEMRVMIKLWKGKMLYSIIESDYMIPYVIRFLIDDKAFELQNGFTVYEYPDKDCTELTCLSIEEVQKSSPIQYSSRKKDIRENIVGEKIQDIYIVKDKETGRLFDSGIPYEFEFETAIIIQTERSCYAFWRNLIFEELESAKRDNMEDILKAIKSVETIQEEEQADNPYKITIERKIEQL